jgi:hypothetical protein
MYTQAHPLISATLVIITCSVIIGNAFVERSSQTETFPAYKPRSSLAETRRHGMMVGKWVGESAVERGGERRVLLERFADGTFKVTFKTQWENDYPVIEQQVGQWGISGPVYFTITTGWVDGDQVDRTDLGQPYYYDAYRIVDVSDDVFEFESFSAETRYLLQRVPDDFSPSDL